VFVDTECDSLNIDLELAAAAASLTTRALVPVHIAGLPCDLDRLEAIRSRTKLAVVHDAAHALGAAWNKRRVGSGRDFSCFSFYATKNLTAGEGGMITTNSKRASERLRRLSLHGMSRGAWRRYATTGSWQYKVDDFGYKYNISDIASALGLAQLRRFEQMQKRRAEIAELYRQSLAAIEELTLPQVPPQAQHAWHLFIVTLRSSHRPHRDRIIRELRDRGVETSVHFIPIFLHNYYRGRFKLDYRDYPNSYTHYRSVISLPFFVDLREREIRHVASSLKSILASLKRKGSSCSMARCSTLPIY
jgi:dTDP-4-amino-4,6-dideoxygalactose transaminase